MDGPVSIHKALADAISALEQTPSPRLDAEVLLSDVLKQPRSYLHARPEALLDAAQTTLFGQYIERRRRGESPAHITGTREFWSTPFSVTADTLVPRPETELLVEKALTLGDTLPQPVSAIDLGTGTGCIALCLARERPDWTVVATDISEATLDVARTNAASLGVSGVQFVHSDWFDAVEPGVFDLVISNPPYIADADPHLEQNELRFEPRHALAAGADGLDAIRKLLKQSAARLSPDGYLLLEIGYDQTGQVKTLARKNGYLDIRFYNDLAGTPRVLTAQHNKS